VSDSPLSVFSFFVRSRMIDNVSQHVMGSSKEMDIFVVVMILLKMRGKRFLLASHFSSFFPAFFILRGFPFPANGGFRVESGGPFFPRRLEDLPF